MFSFLFAILEFCFEKKVNNLVAKDQWPVKPKNSYGYVRLLMMILRDVFGGFWEFWDDLKIISGKSS
jgi:hypothetical protein